METIDYSPVLHRSPFGTNAARPRAGCITHRSWNDAY